jgi:hypothetical protein
MGADMKQNILSRGFNLVLWLIVSFVIAGCRTITREPQEHTYLIRVRTEANERLAKDTHQLSVKLLERIKAEQDDYLAGRRNAPPVIDILLISGGGDWGAFGAGFLKGWGTVPKSHAMARPEFDIVTGVSTGALIAPFAFIGDDPSIESVVQLYRNPKKDWVKNRWPVAFLPNNVSLAKVPGLERELRENMSPGVVRKIAEAGKNGRVLAVNTTCLDDASARVFYITSEAQRANDSGDLSRIHDIMLASAGIPGAFPYREIDGEMYVDGGVTSNILYGGRASEEQSLPAVWKELYPNAPVPKTRFWVIFNNQAQAPPTVVPARWIEIVTRAVTLSTRAATLTAIRHLYAKAEVSRLKRDADIEVRTVMIPNDWVPPKPGAFVKETMNNLADLGEKMGTNPSSWSTEPPAP